MAAFSSIALVGMAGLGAYSAYAGASNANRQAAIQEENAERKYRLQAGVADQQMTEQQQIVMEQMSDVSREFIVAKSNAQAVQADSGVAGVSQRRMGSVMSTKEQDVKGKVVSEASTNMVNIAQGMLANKVDTESMIAEARSRKRNVITDTVIGGIQGGIQGYTMGKSFSSGSSAASTSKAALGQTSTATSIMK